MEPGVINFRSTTALWFAMFLKGVPGHCSQNPYLQNFYPKIHAKNLCQKIVGSELHSPHAPRMEKQVRQNTNKLEISRKITAVLFVVLLVNRRSDSLCPD
jgi:hypothetical protein